MRIAAASKMIMIGLTLGSRFMERNPLQTVATMNVRKLNQMVGIFNTLRMEMFLDDLRMSSSES
jgi:hypothetical protein